MAANDELELLRTALLRDRTLFTIQRNASHSNDDSIRVDFFTSKGVDRPGLMRVTGLVASVLNYRKGPRGLIISERGEVEGNLVAMLSRKLELDLKHQRIVRGAADSLGSE